MEKKTNEEEKKLVKRNLVQDKINIQLTSLEQKKEMWLRKFWVSMRYQGESTDDEFSIFTPSNYELWKSEDSDIDAILEFVIDELDKMHSGDGKIVVKIYDRLKKKKTIHHQTIKAYNGSLETLAEDVGNLRYDALQLFLDHLSNKLQKDSKNDEDRGRIKLASCLSNAAKEIILASNEIEKAWKISKPFMSRVKED